MMAPVSQLRWTSVRNRTVVGKFDDYDMEEVKSVANVVWLLLSPFHYVFHNSLQALCWFAVVILLLMLLLSNFPRQINPSVDSEFISMQSNDANNIYFRAIE
jgi:hypothetical protein